jgi:hypothetical protein
MRTALLIFLFVVGALAFKQVWMPAQSRQNQCLYGALAVGCWIAMAVVGYAAP